MPIEITKLLIILISIMFLLKIRLNLGLNLLLNSLLMGLLFRIDILQIFIIWKKAAMNLAMFELLGIIFLVYFLSIVLEKLKKFEGMVFSLQKMIEDYRLIMMLISSFVALLPIQGGAIFSAPMIKSIGKVNHVIPENNMFINYWFRHIWLFVWPLYPEVILYGSLLGISLKDLIIRLSPLAFIALLSGAIWVYFTLTKRSSHQNKSNTKYIIILKDFIDNTWPVLLIIFSVLFFNISLLFSLLLVVFILLIYHFRLRNQMISLLSEAIKAGYRTLLMIFGIFIFKEMLEFSQVIELLPNYFLSIGVPVHVILILVPFLVAFFTGSIFACVGICVPVFLVFLTDTNGVITSQMILLYIAGYIGLMVTPIHLCLAITKDYFQMKTSKFYYILMIHLSILIVFAYLYYIFLQNILN